MKLNVQWALKELLFTQKYIVNQHSFDNYGHVRKASAINCNDSADVVKRWLHMTYSIF